VLEVADVDPDPLEQFGRWLEEARRTGEPLADAMTVATATPDGRPSARLVLLRGLDDGLVFFTDYESDKARDLEANPRAAAVFHWYAPEHRQVRVTGPVARVSAAESDAYWQTRPPGSRRSAATSRQSRVVPSRAVLEAGVVELARQYPDDSDVPRPRRWGGYRILPETIELWQERPDRLHDRLRYRRENERWIIERLSP
jgi:pyridoxamine 5'-phosphate oxidase